VKEGEDMERVQDAENTIEVFESDIDFYLNEFIEKYQIEDISKEPQSRWNAALMYIQRHVFPKDDNKLKCKDNIYINNIKLINNNSSNCNSYDYDLVNQICDYYIYLCMVNDKEVSCIGFSNLTGINNDSLMNWAKNEELNNSSYDIYKKLNQSREESLSNKLVTGKQNPVGILGVLNRHYSWNLPGVSREQTTNKQLTASQLPRLDNTQDIQAIDVTSDVKEP
jgi:hypothetical protein